MFLSRIHLDPHSKEARRDLADPYQLHSTLCRAFSSPEHKCPENEFLWRLEPETDERGYPRVLVQSKSLPDWGSISLDGWLASADPAIDLMMRLKINSFEPAQSFRFRLRANPSVCRNGKRFGLMKSTEQAMWLVRKSQQHGFSLAKLRPFDLIEAPQDSIDVRISHEEMLRGKQHNGQAINVFSVLYEGSLTITEVDKFKEALGTGIGHAKFAGLGLLSIVPII